MPAKMRGSVSVRFSVWRSRVERASGTRRQVGVEHLEPARDRAPRAPSAPRTTWSDARFRVLASVRISVPAREVERREPDLPRDARPRRLPVEPARDHQVQDEEEVVLEPEDDALPEAAEAGDPSAPTTAASGGLDRAQEERAPDPHPAETLARRPAASSALDVDGHVGQLRHEADRARGRGASGGTRPRLAPPARDDVRSAGW